jgi:hypothetical protein
VFEVGSAILEASYKDAGTIKKRRRCTTMYT